jgi:hypothetical protein
VSCHFQTMASLYTIEAYLTTVMRTSDLSVLEKRPFSDSDTSGEKLGLNTTISHTVIRPKS